MRRLDETLALWLTALNSEFGVKIKQPYLESVGIDPKQMVADLYQSRKESGDTRLFQFYIHQVKDEVWIVRCSAPEIKSNGEYKALEDT